VDIPLRVQACVALAEPSMVPDDPDHDDPCPYAAHGNHRLQHLLLCWELSTEERAEICRRLFCNELGGSRLHYNIGVVVWLQGRRRSTVAPEPRLKLPIVVVRLCHSLGIFLHLCWTLRLDRLHAHWNRGGEERKAGGIRSET